MYLCVSYVCVCKREIRGRERERERERENYVYEKHIRTVVGKCFSDDQWRQAVFFVFRHLSLHLARL